MTWKLLLTGGLLAAVGAVGFHYLPRRGPESLEAHGAVEIQEVRLGSRVGGRVCRLAVFEGQRVAPGQALVYLEAPELEARRGNCQARLEAAEAELARAKNGPRQEEKEAARAAVASARARLQRLKAGYRAEEIAQARGEADAADAELARAARELARERRLGPSASSPSGGDAAVAAHERAQGKARAARARLAMLRAGSRPEDVAEAEAELKRACANCRLLEAGTRAEDIAQAEARVREAGARLREVEAHLDDLTIRSPGSGVVEVLAVRLGDLLSPNQPAVRVLLDGDLWVRAYVSEVALGKARLNQPAEVFVDSHPGKPFPGRVVQIASASEFTPRNVQSADERHHQVFAVKIRVVAPEGIFKSGMAARVVLPVQE